MGGALHVRALAEFYGVPVILHTDHCSKALLPWFDGLLEVGMGTGPGPHCLLMVHSCTFRFLPNALLPCFVGLPARRATAIATAATHCRRPPPPPVAPLTRPTP